MGDGTRQLRDILAADARRRSKLDRPSAPAAVAPGEAVASLEPRLRLVNVFPRLTRPLFASLSAELAPFSYALSPLHPVPDLSRPRMQTELTRVAEYGLARYAPLIFELDPRTASVRVHVQQPGGHAAPGFADRAFDLAADPDLTALEGILHDYVRCVLATQPLAPA